MSAAADLAMQATAERLIAEKGRAMTLRKLTAGTYDPATAGATPTQTDTACQGVEVKHEVKSIDGTLIQAGDLRMMLGARSLAADPDAGDLLIDSDAKQWRIVAVKRVKPGSVNVVYIVWVRG